MGIFRGVEQPLCLENSNSFNSSSALSFAWPVVLSRLTCYPSQQTIVSEWNRDGRWQDVEDVFRAAAYDTECPEIVKEGSILDKIDDLSQT